MRLESNGKAFEDKTGIDYYKVNKNSISTFYNKSAYAIDRDIPVEQYKVVFVNEKYLLLEFYDEINKNKIIPEFIRYKRKQRFIDSETLK